MSVRDLVIDLFAEHVDAVTQEPVRLQSLVDLLGDLGVAEPTTRMATAALRRAGLLAASRRGRETLYTPTERLRAMVRERQARLDDRMKPWDGYWGMVIYTVPESERAARERVRRTLTRHGFGPLAPATWVSPHSGSLQDVRAELAGEPLARLDLLTARVSGGTAGSDVELMARCWDLSEVEAGYRALLGRLQTAADSPPPDGGSALVLHLRLLAELRRLLTEYPILPAALRPPGWPGQELCDAWTDVRARLVGPAREHVAAVLADGVAGRPTQRYAAELSG
ncbi:MAG TPA: PaaX family transcriptional regulator C-terminal domain-containing protein [Geodermatophilus sp.]|nr:PaaX family transcriptional regulator C-terminal domain-containing protein [Geodermatophilus sp.]